MRGPLRAGSSSQRRQHPLPRPPPATTLACRGSPNTRSPSSTQLAATAVERPSPASTRNNAGLAVGLAGRRIWSMPAAPASYGAWSMPVS
nr:unnamed protein product [Digitaria exilis]